MFPPVVMRRMAELNQARSREAYHEQPTTNTSCDEQKYNEGCDEHKSNKDCDEQKSNKGCDEQSCSRITGESVLSDATIHATSTKTSTEESDFIEKHESRSESTRIREESVLTSHARSINTSIEDPDFSKRPESRSQFTFNCLNSSASRCDNFNEEALTPSDVEYSDGARDLIQRLLNPDPQKRLRSLLSLQNIRFFKDFDFANVRTKKISPKEVLLRHYPSGPQSLQPTESTAYFFEDFDSIHI